MSLSEQDQTVSGMICVKHIVAGCILSKSDKRQSVVLPIKCCCALPLTDCVRLNAKRCSSPVRLSHVSRSKWSQVLDRAYDWLCHTRKTASHHSDVWNLRRRWPDEREVLLKQLTSGHYRFAPLLKIKSNNPDAACSDQWSARDALVLKAMTYLLSSVLPSSGHCTHLQGHGGAKGAVRQVAQAIKDYRVYCRTDVKSFYASIDHLKLMDRLSVYVANKSLLNLVGQYLRRTVEYGGTFQDIKHGISAGCPLSPLMGAFYLYELDCAITSKHPRCFYVRFMDDILIMAPSRWQLRRAIATMNRCLEDLGLEQHPDKTSMGPLARGFEYLGYGFSRSGLTLADKTRRNHQTKLSRLYEQYRKRRVKPDVIEAALNIYIRRFNAWAKGGLNDLQYTEEMDNCGTG